MSLRCQCGNFTESSSGLCADCAGRSRIYNSSGFVGFADEVRRGACDCGKVECLICGRDEQRIIADLRAKLAAAQEEIARLRDEIGEAREACPIVRRQDYFDASLLTAVNETEIERLYSSSADPGGAQSSSPLSPDGVWRCEECGEAQGLDPRWRWNGERWQHHHSYPVGHVDARYFGPAAAGGAQPSAVTSEPSREKLLEAFTAGFQWAINGTDKHGEYNGGPLEIGFVYWERESSASAPSASAQVQALREALEEAVDLMRDFAWHVAGGHDVRAVREFLARADALLASPTGADGQAHG